MNGHRPVCNLNVSGNAETAVGSDSRSLGLLSKGTRVSFFTLGCKVNQVETEALREEFISNGYEVVDSAMWLIFIY